MNYNHIYCIAQFNDGVVGVYWCNSLLWYCQL